MNSLILEAKEKYLISQGQIHALSYTKTLKILNGFLTKSRLPRTPSLFMWEAFVTDLKEHNFDKYFAKPFRTYILLHESIRYVFTSEQNIMNEHVKRASEGYFLRE